MTQRGTQATGLAVDRGSSDSQHGRPDRHPSECRLFFFSGTRMTS